MNKMIESKQDNIEALCKQFHVAALEVFGSVVGDAFVKNQSDIDFMVEFTPEGIKHYADNYFGLLAELTQLFDHSIDLVVRSSVRNPYFLESVEATMESLYAA